MLNLMKFILIMSYFSASTSEGFGLTLMEAVGSGLGMIGLNVNYGNPTFIRDGEMATWHL